MAEPKAGDPWPVRHCNSFDEVTVIFISGSVRNEIQHIQLQHFNISSRVPPAVRTNLVYFDVMCLIGVYSIVRRGRHHRHPSNVFEAIDKIVV